MKTIRMIAVAALALVALLAAAPAYGQAAGGSPCSPGGPNNSNNPNRSQYPPSECGLRLGKSQARPGEPVDITGEGYKGNSNVQIEFRSVPQSMGSATTNSSGTFTKTVTIPADAAPGRHTIVATGFEPSGAPRELSAEITITAAATSAAARTATLPRTGGQSTLPLVAGGVALVALGGVALVAARRRRTTV